MSNSQQNKNWSLQDNKRTQQERDAFKPTGKTKKKSTTLYVLSVVLVVFLASLTLTLSAKETLEACVFSEFCFNSKDNVILYSLYVFTTIAIIVLAVGLAYKFGKRLGEQFKQ